jgi:non-specific serine/threonine protein kinase
MLQYQIGETSLLLNCVELLAGLMGDSGQAEPAATLLGACAALRQNTGLSMPPMSRSTCARDLAVARAALGKQRFATAWAAGSGMTVDRLADYARRTYAASSRPQVVPRDPVSPRERQVLALLARGYTNRQIARELVISGRTADGHVAHILTKLGLSTRAQAAVWAVEHPLPSAAKGSQH